MTATTTAPQGYSATQIALHWVVAVLIAGQYIFKDAISGAWDTIRAGETYAFDPLILGVDADLRSGGLGFRRRIFGKRPGFR